MLRNSGQICSFCCWHGGLTKLPLSHHWSWLDPRVRQTREICNSITRRKMVGSQHCQDLHITLIHRLWGIFIFYYLVYGIIYYNKVSINTVSVSAIFEITWFFLVGRPSYFGTNLSITRFLEKFSVSANILKNHYT